MINQNNSKLFLMEDIYKHLKAENEILEMHTMIDNLLATDIVNIKPTFNYIWKYLALISVLIVTSLNLKTYILRKD